ncbi:NAD(P)H-dependent oxidoreductase [Ruegeria conchae]|uniref:Putative NADPH-quinone reductase n=1 Tax=Ruegeria conchae TaxID=981384 RepID=A0A497Z840_9RHOB|nr:NAD(P)H-dependent oxidoreductase [Ruegeria conchae]RLK02705.1 putative NADPH-quinone reductase [Ruegeria conchae]
MPAKKILVLNGHPAESSLSRTFAQTYADAAIAKGHEVRMVHLSDLQFDHDFGQGNYEDFKPLEPVLEQVLQDIEWSDHLVLTTPMWWGGLPAKLKGLIDRTFIPGRTFDTRNTTKIGLPAPMLSGRTARVILTSDTPGWFMRLIYRQALLRQLRDQVLGFVGFKPTRFTYFASASYPNPGSVERWIGKVARMGAAAL